MVGSTPNSPETLSAERVLARRDAACWFALAIASLAIAAVFSIVLVVGRTPVLAAVFASDVDFPRRSLVVHVNLSLGVWFFCILAGLFCLLPGARPRRMAPLAVGLSTIGTILFIIPMFFRSATPVLSDYILVLNNSLFFAGLIVFTVGIILNFIDPRMLPTRAVESDIPEAAQHGLRVAALTFCVAIITMIGAHFSMPADSSLLSYYQYLFWGGGHILQAVNVLGMLVVWLILLRYLTGRSVLPSAIATALFVLILLPNLAGPFWTFGGAPQQWFTRLMEFGIFPAVLIFLAYGIAALWRSKSTLDIKNPAFVGWVASALMAVIGFILGGMITVSNTLIPAHYHANIGAVTVAYMAGTLILLKEVGFTFPGPRIAAWQPAIYAVGQMIFVLGYAIAGKIGDAARKVYGQEPHHHPAQLIGMGIAGFGGAIALVGGVIFVIIVINTVRKSRKHHDDLNASRELMDISA